MADWWFRLSLGASHPGREPLKYYHVEDDDASSPPCRSAAGSDGPPRVLYWAMPERRLPAPWSAEETDACFIVGDHSAYVKFSDTGKSNAPGPGGHKDGDSPTHTRR